MRILGLTKRSAMLDAGATCHTGSAKNAMFLADNGEHIVRNNP